MAVLSAILTAGVTSATHAMQMKHSVSSNEVIKCTVAVRPSLDFPVVPRQHHAKTNIDHGCEWTDHGLHHNTWQCGV